MAGIVLENLSKRFNGTRVIPGLSLAIADGEFFTFVGPSGCGKSTILNMIAGLAPASGGRILFDGKDVSGLAPRDRDVAMVFQSYALYPHMTVYENLAFPLRMKKARKEVAAEEVRRVADLLGIGDMLERKPRELSGGQRQRVALGRAIIRRPRVFLMDEPLSNLDARLRVEMRSELKRLHRELRITTVYVTHDQAEAMGLSERMAVLDRGRVAQCAPPGEVYSRPASAFVAGFIGSPPINLLPGTAAGDGRSILCGDVWLAAPAGIAIAPGSAVLAGIRPEDVTVSGSPAQGAMEAAVEMIEPAGAFNWADVRRGGITLRGRADERDAPRSGGRAYVSFPAGKVHVFNAESGQRL
jgi:ABC-type sugar transport system ATPase subunit